MWSPKTMFVYLGFHWDQKLSVSSPVDLVKRSTKSGDLQKNAFVLFSFIFPSSPFEFPENPRRPIKKVFAFWGGHLLKTHANYKNDTKSDTKKKI